MAVDQRQWSPAMAAGPGKLHDRENWKEAAKTAGEECSNGYSTLADRSRDACGHGRIYRLRIPSGAAGQTGQEQRPRLMDAGCRGRPSERQLGLPKLTGPLPETPVVGQFE